MAKEVVRKNKSTVRRKKRGEDLDPRVLALGAGAAGAVAGGAYARSKVKRTRTTMADRIKMAKQAIKSVPTYRRDMQDVADAKNRIRYGKDSLKQVSSVSNSYDKSQRFTQNNTSAPSLAQREIMNRKSSALNNIESGKYNAITAESKMARNRQAVGSLVNSAASIKSRANTAEYKYRANKATKRGAIKGAASAATIALVVSQVLKELNKK